MVVIYQVRISTTAHSKIKRTGFFILGIFLIIVLVQILSLVKNNPIVFPNVFEIFKALFNLLINKNTYEMIGFTLLRLLISLIISLIIGVIIGIFEGLNNNIRLILKPLMVILRSLPMIVLVVIFMVLVSSKGWKNIPIISTSILLIPLISEAVAEGIKNMDKALIDVYKLNSNLRPFVIFKVHIPLILGYLKQAFVNAIGMGIKIIVTTEFIVSVAPSLGKGIFNAQYLNEFENIYAYAIIMVLLVLIIEYLPTFIINLIKYFKTCKKQ